MASASHKITEWVKLYTDELYNWAVYKTKHHELAEDFVQETFVAALNNFDKFQGKSSPKTWLFSILKNKIADHFRKKIRQNTVTESDVASKESDSILDKFFDNNNEWLENSKPIHWEVNTEELLDNEEFNKILAFCMSQLNEISLLSIQYKFLEGKEGKLICQELGITPSNFWQLLHRAKLQLRQCIEKNWKN